MKSKNAFIGALLSLIQSKSIQPALMTLALVAAVLGVTGCSPHH